MVRQFKELNQLEKLGLIDLLKIDGWTHCLLGDVEAYTKQLGSKEITIKKEDFWIDED